MGCAQSTEAHAEGARSSRSNHRAVTDRRPGSGSTRSARVTRTSSPIRNPLAAVPAQDVDDDMDALLVDVIDRWSNSGHPTNTTTTNGMLPSSACPSEDGTHHQPRSQSHGASSHRSRPPPAADGKSKSRLRPLGKSNRSKQHRRAVASTASKTSGKNPHDDDDLQSDARFAMMDFDDEDAFMTDAELAAAAEHAFSDADTDILPTATSATEDTTTHAEPQQAAPAVLNDDLPTTTLVAVSTHRQSPVAVAVVDSELSRRAGVDENAALWAFEAAVEQSGRRGHQHNAPVASARSEDHSATAGAAAAPLSSARANSTVPTTTTGTAMKRHSARRVDGDMLPVRGRGDGPTVDGPTVPEQPGDADHRRRDVQSLPPAVEDSNDVQYDEIDYENVSAESATRSSSVAPLTEANVTMHETRLRALAMGRSVARDMDLRAWLEVVALVRDAKSMRRNPV